jgi:mono/diheme cytochrome c family protein
MKTKLFVLIVAFAAGATAQNAPTKDLFVSKCAICHGADGGAKTSIGKNLKVRDFHLAEGQKLSDAELTTIITKGKGKMPAFTGKLTGEQIDQLVAHVRELGKQK